MSMEMAMDKQTAMDNNGDGWRWKWQQTREQESITMEIYGNGSNNGQEDGNG